MAATTGQLGLLTPTQGTLSGTWGDTVNNGITEYTNLAIAATLTLTGDGAVTLANTTGSASATNITSTLAGAGTVTAQHAVIYVSGALTATKVITGPSYSKTYVVINGATGGSVTIKASGQTGVTIAVGEKALVAFNGTDYVNIGAGVAQVYPGAGIANSTGTAWGTSYTTTGTGTVVALATSPSFTTPALGTPASGNLTSCTADGTNSVGFLNIPQNSQSAAYTLVLADAGKHIFHPVGDNNARTFTIPANSSVAYSIGTAITFINMAVANVTIAITTDTLTLSPAGTSGSRTLAQYGSATCIKITSTQWLISGSGLT